MTISKSFCHHKGPYEPMERDEYTHTLLPASVNLSLKSSKSFHRPHVSTHPLWTEGKNCLTRIPQSSQGFPLCSKWNHLQFLYLAVRPHRFFTNTSTRSNSIRLQALHCISVWFHLRMQAIMHTLHTVHVCFIALSTGPNTFASS